MSANFLEVYGSLGGFAKSGAGQASAASARIAGVAREGLQLAAEGLTFHVSNTVRSVGAAAQSRSPDQLANVQREWLEGAMLRVVADVKSCIDLTGRLLSETASVAVAPVPAPAPVVAAPAPIVSAPVVPAPIVPVAVAPVVVPAAVDAAPAVEETPAVEPVAVVETVVESVAVEAAVVEAVVVEAAPVEPVAVVESAPAVEEAAPAVEPAAAAAAVAVESIAEPAPKGRPQRPVRRGRGGPNAR